MSDIAEHICTYVAARERLQAELATANAALAEARRMISEINDENERLSAELVSKADELAAMKKQRDDAREGVCRLTALRRKERGLDFDYDPDPKAIAADRGWDCFEKKAGGGA